MIKHKRTTEYGNNRGAALITVLAVIMVLMVIVLSVVAIAYQNYMMSANEMNEQKCREVVQSLSDELRREIVGTKYNSYAEMQADTSNDHYLWRYLRENVGQESWAYYDGSHKSPSAYKGTSDPFVWSDLTTNEASDIEAAARYFQTSVETAEGDVEELPITTVRLYWSPGNYSDRLEGVELHVAVTAKMGDYSYTIRDCYTLQTSTYAGVTDAETLDTVSVHTGERIYCNQKWEWVYDREEE